MHYTISSTSEYTYSDQGSRFITFACPAAGENEISENLDHYRNLYPDATHHCYAWRITPAQPQEFANDDGEPSGTAGQPILNEIKSQNLINIVIIVVRYFGGIKLGKPGLIHAYRTSAKSCLENAKIIPIHHVRNLKITFPYSEQKMLDQLNRKYGFIKTGETYLADVTWEIICPEDTSANLLSELEHQKHRGIITEDLGSSYEAINPNTG